MKQAQQTPSNTNNQAGFTLAETLIVMVLSAIITMIGYISINALLPQHRLSGAVRVVKADLHRAKMLAVEKSSDYQVIFTTSGYEVKKKGGGTENSKSFEDYPGITVKTPATISFKQRGLAAPGSITLRNTEGDEKRLSISIAGRVKIN